MSTHKIPIGISSCLLGENVRYDGNNKHDRYITGTLSEIFEFTPLCPEVAIGLGVPRTPIRLINRNDAHRAVNINNYDEDVTEKLQTYADEESQKQSHISGYIFKKGSPSCGIERVKVYNNDGIPQGKAMGIYAERFTQNCPTLPYEDEGRLSDPGLRENFIKKVLIYNRWQEMTSNETFTSKALIEFHQQHKFIIMSFSHKKVSELGRLLADMSKDSLEEISVEYMKALMTTMAKPATRKNHVNTMQHIQGYLKKEIDTKDKQELNDVIKQYQSEEVPLIVPITLLKHHFYRHPHPYVESSFYLNPYPQMLKLMNNI